MVLLKLEDLEGPMSLPMAPVPAIVPTTGAGGEGGGYMGGGDAGGGGTYV